MPTHQKVISFIIIAAVLAANFALVLFAGSQAQYDISVGQVCPEDIYAPRNITDTVTTQARKKAAYDAVADVYVTDASITTLAVDDTRDFIAALYAAREDDTESDKVRLLQANSKIDIDRSVLSLAVSLSSSQYQALTRISDYVEEIMTKGVSDREEAISTLLEMLSENSSSEAVSSVAYAIADNVISVNKELDPDATEAARKAASDLVTDVTYMKNQIIVRRGEIVSEAQLAMLTELGFIKGTTSIDLFHIISSALLLILGVVIAVIYYSAMARRVLSATPVTVTAICAIMTVGGTLLIYASGFANIYLMPLAACPALITLLLSADLSIIVNIFIALTAALYTGDFATGFLLALAGTAASVLFSHVRRRVQLLPATLLTSLFYSLIYAASYTDVSKNIPDILRVLIFGFGGALLGGIVTIGTIPFWEAIFDVITPMKLGELSNPEHKLLKELLLKAPGSYHHALTVANMADAAAEAIGANTLLARVGAYYHDIGKMKNPMFFKENQITSANPHDNLTPEESAEIIIRHVKDGKELADEYHLPSIVKDIIVQHHGTTTASYFLYKAREKNPDIDEALFTYPGPNPTTKEATIIMLADACEAAVRAVRESSNADARAIVEDLISSRIAAGQLSSSQLTFEDLERVKDSFIKTLGQYFHKRIIYPQNKAFTEPKKEEAE